MTDHDVQVQPRPDADSHADDSAGAVRPLTVSQWAGAHRQIQAAAANPDPPRTDLAQHLGELMDRLAARDPCHEVAVLKAAQGGTGFVLVAFQALKARLLEKAALARRVAKDAHKRGDKKKHDKFNAVARVYEMISADLGPLCDRLPPPT